MSADRNLSMLSCQVEAIVNIFFVEPGLGWEKGESSWGEGKRGIKIMFLVSSK